MSYRQQSIAFVLS